MLRNLVIAIALAVPIQTLGGAFNDLGFWERDRLSYNKANEFYQHVNTVAVSFGEDVPEEKIPAFFKKLFDSEKTISHSYPIGVVVDRDCHQANSIIRALQENFSHRMVILITGREGLPDSAFKSFYIANPFLRMELLVKADKFYPSQESPMALVATLTKNKDTSVLCSKSMIRDSQENHSRSMFGEPAVHDRKFEDDLGEVKKETPDNLRFRIGGVTEIAEFVPPKFKFTANLRSVEVSPTLQTWWSDSILKLFDRMPRERRSAFFASGDEKAVGPYGELCAFAASAAVTRGYAVLTGGAGGLMQPINRAAKDWDGDSVGVTLSNHRTERSQDEDHTLSLATGGYDRRIPCLLMGCQRVNVCPGGSGTLKELAAAITSINSLLPVLRLKEGTLAGYDPEDPDFKLNFLSSKYYSSLFDLITGKRPSAEMPGRQATESQDPQKLVDGRFTGFEWGRFLLEQNRLAIKNNAKEIVADF